MNSKYNNLSRSSGRQPGRYYLDALPHQTPGYAVPAPASNAEKKCCLEDYFEVMSPGFENWGVEQGGASESSFSVCNKVMVASETPLSSHLVDLHNLPYKKRPYSSLNIDDPYKLRNSELKLPSAVASGTQPMDNRDDSVPVAGGSSNLVEPVKGGPAECLSEANKKHMNLFKQKLVEHIKLLLDPEWKKHSLSKDVYKEIVMKATAKVVESIPVAKIPDTPQKMELYLSDSKKKILKLVEQYRMRLQLQKARSSKP